MTPIKAVLDDAAAQLDVLIAEQRHDLSLRLIEAGFSSDDVDAVLAYTAQGVDGWRRVVLAGLQRGLEQRYRQGRAGRAELDASPRGVADSAGSGKPRESGQTNDLPLDREGRFSDPPPAERPHSGSRPAVAPDGMSRDAPARPAAARCQQSLNHAQRANDAAPI